MPIHQKLLQSRFLDYIEQRKQQGAIQLFDLVPRGDDLDWSKDYRDVFGDVLDACRFKARQRPTAYSFRHTVVDELQKAGIEEHVVAQIVGHKHNTMTYSNSLRSRHTFASQKMNVSCGQEKSLLTLCHANQNGWHE
ncbi:site-specific integrase [Vibrio algarum]|uniref:Tyr recombinase domain-containing protein n=1 Tax=Vibrio algarum TaxID=3020714 RepID=A0ABT4YN53_9VIBR|nr:hypothetical protein [Vibrio sp. KJ40-1]MDB1122646.1 hypothetical protein [Vibrio sp. KJ40-1]